ncbi:MAG: hypothetical protein ABF868_09845 [Sporolactobacillus sp.]
MTPSFTDCDNYLYERLHPCSQVVEETKTAYVQQLCEKYPVQKPVHVVYAEDAATTKHTHAATNSDAASEYLSGKRLVSCRAAHAAVDSFLASQCRKGYARRGNISRLQRLSKLSVHRLSVIEQ